MDRFIARMKKASGSSRRGGGDKTTPHRKLERIGALKNVKYDAASSSSSSSADDLSVSTSSLMTRSLEVDRTSFRIGGSGDGELDRIYKSLGVSGPDDLAISFDAWEASMLRSSSEVINRFNSFDHDPSGDADSDIGSLAGGTKENKRGLERVMSRGYLVPSSGDNVVADVVVAVGGTKENKRGLERVMSRGYLVPSSGDNVVADVVVTVGGIKENKRGLERLMSKGYRVPSSGDNVVADVVAVGGIKGVRPSVLKPPPAKRPPIDHHGSSWDFLTHLGPEDEVVKRPSSSSSSSSDKGEEVETQERLLDTADESCSFTTNEGGDSSSSVSNTSPVYTSGSVITSWLKGQLLGRGSFGSVYEGISGDGDFFAVKEVSLLEQGREAQECIQQLEREIALLSRLQHQNIVRYRGTAKDGSNLYIFLELVSQGSLLKTYQRYQLPDSVVSTYTRQILDGLKYLHGEGFIHRDIKCANILVDTSGAVKLADFGLAKVSRLNDIKSSKGTPFWMAPEVINPKRTEGYGSSADIWSLGCTVLEMLTQKIPYFDLENPYQALYRIGKGELPDIPDSLSLDARDFIIRCLRVNPDERPTAAELLNHPFVKRPLSSSGSGIKIFASP
ncbi:Mitogen-activated protein kinase kinase kinase 9 [Hirschfeldia incana]|nr:Mitogen-activated protein kinase kinase kinase 9 [Hirschfeldia incana]